MEKIREGYRTFVEYNKRKVFKGKRWEYILEYILLYVTEWSKRKEEC